MYTGGHGRAIVPGVVRDVRFPRQRAPWLDWSSVSRSPHTDDLRRRCRPVTGTLLLVILAAAGCRTQRRLCQPGTVRASTSPAAAAPHATRGPRASSAEQISDEALIHDLGASSHAVREPAVEELARRAPRTIPLLIGALRDDHRDFAAAKSLSLVAEPERTVVPLLIQLLDSDSEEIPTKKAAAGALKELGSKGAAAIPILVRLVEQGGIDTRILDGTVRRHRDWSAQAALSAMGSAAVDPVALLVGSPSGQISTDALRILAHIGRPSLSATSAWLAALEHESVYTRLAALRALTEIGALTADLRERVRTLAQSDPESSVREEASELLERTAQ